MINNNTDFTNHNEQVKALWQDYYSGKNKRVPMTIACNPRMILLDEQLNTAGYTFEQYFNSPEIMAAVQLQFIEYRDTALWYDHIMGIDNINFSLYVDYQNVMEPNWFGCPISFNGQDPGTMPILNDENKYDYLKQKIEPISGIYEKALRFYEYFLDMQKSGFLYKNKPIAAVYEPGEGIDGPFTTACSIRGTTEMCLDLYLDTDFALELMDYITENNIKRIKAFRKYFGKPEKTSKFYFADDSIALLSAEDYIKYVLPFHKRLYEELSTGEEGGWAHFCGNATRHFKTVSQEVNITSFDTGFPVNFGQLQKELGADIQISGGVHVDILLNGNTEQIKAETKRILEEVKPLTNRFIIKEANNLSPRTPPTNIKAMYDAVKEFGYFE